MAKVDRGMRGKSIVVKVRIPKNWYDALQKMVRQGRSTTVAGAVRDGIWLLLQLRASEEKKSHAVKDSLAGDSS